MQEAFSGVTAQAFPFLFGGTFIEAFAIVMGIIAIIISLPFRRDFH